MGANLNAGSSFARRRRPNVLSLSKYLSSLCAARDKRPGLALHLAAQSRRIAKSDRNRSAIPCRRQQWK